MHPQPGFLAFLRRGRLHLLPVACMAGCSALAFAAAASVPVGGRHGSIGQLLVWRRQPGGSRREPGGGATGVFFGDTPVPGRRAVPAGLAGFVRLAAAMGGRIGRAFRNNPTAGFSGKGGVLVQLATVVVGADAGSRGFADFNLRCPAALGLAVAAVVFSRCCAATRRSKCLPET